jgi:putative endonuclease
MGAGRIVRALVRVLDGVLGWFPRREAEHLKTGRTGEESAYFFLRDKGYTMVARNWRTVSRRGEIDLIGWDGATLCFVEVKTRGTRSVVPAEFAVDGEKQEELRMMARVYMRRMERVSTRFDVVSVYMEGREPALELRKDAFGWKGR